jgi:hypothetical protein
MMRGRMMRGSMGSGNTVMREVSGAQVVLWVGQTTLARPHCCSSGGPLSWHMKRRMQGMGVKVLRMGPGACPATRLMRGERMRGQAGSMERKVMRGQGVVVEAEGAATGRRSRMRRQQGTSLGMTLVSWLADHLTD